VWDGLARLDRGRIDVFDVDALIERYDLAARSAPDALRLVVRRHGDALPARWSFVGENGEARDW
jgi:hypothetical protein